MQIVAHPGTMGDIAPAEHPAEHVHQHHGFFWTYIWSHDHKMIGKQYLLASMDGEPVVSEGAPTPAPRRRHRPVPMVEKPFLHDLSS